MSLSDTTDPLAVWWLPKGPTPPPPPLAVGRRCNMIANKQKKWNRTTDHNAVEGKDAFSKEMKRGLNTRHGPLGWTWPLEGSSTHTGPVEPPPGGASGAVPAGYAAAVVRGARGTVGRPLAPHSAIVFLGGRVATQCVELERQRASLPMGWGSSPPPLTAIARARDWGRGAGRGRGPGPVRCGAGHREGRRRHYGGGGGGPRGEDGGIGQQQRQSPGRCHRCRGGPHRHRGWAAGGGGEAVRGDHHSERKLGMEKMMPDIREKKWDHNDNGITRLRSREWWCQNRHCGSEEKLALGKAFLSFRGPPWPKGGPVFGGLSGGPLLGQ